MRAITLGQGAAARKHSTASLPVVDVTRVLPELSRSSNGLNSVLTFVIKRGTVCSIFFVDGGFVGRSSRVTSSVQLGVSDCQAGGVYRVPIYEEVSRCGGSSHASSLLGSRQLSWPAAAVDLRLRLPRLDQARRLLLPRPRPPHLVLQVQLPPRRNSRTHRRQPAGHLAMLTRPL